MGKKEETANADELMETLKSMDGRKVGLGEMQVLEKIIEKTEPLMTKSKTQVMSQILIEADPEKLSMNDVKELTEIVMKASDDITPGEIEDIAQLTRTADDTLTEKEVKVVAEMSSKFGDSLSQREVQMIGRMMRSSGLTMTLNDIAMVAEVMKVRNDNDNEISDNDAKLIAKMTEIIDETPNESNVFTTTAKPFIRVSMLPKQPTISTLPESVRRPPRIKMNMRLQNRPPPRTYLATEAPEKKPLLKLSYSTIPPPVEVSNDGDFGLRDLQNMIKEVEEKPLITFGDVPPPPSEIESVRNLAPPRVVSSRNPIKPTLDTLKTTLDPLPTGFMGSPEESTQIKLEEFLMRNRPTPFRTFPSEDTPQEDDFNDAVRSGGLGRPTEIAGRPTEATTDDIFELPGDSFMQISMGKSSFGDKKTEKLQIRDQKTPKKIAQPPKEIAQPEMTVTRDTIKSVAENFAFTKNEPQGMLMNFLMKKKLPPMPTQAPATKATPTQPPPAVPTTTEMSFFGMMTRDPLTNLFNIESTTLDKSNSGNFMHMQLGINKPTGVDPKKMQKLKKNRIALSEDNNSFMSMQMGDLMRRRISERMSTIAAASNDKDLVKANLRRPIRKIKAHRPPKMAAPKIDRIDVEERIHVDQTPFTARPTLPVGQATLWPQDTAGTLKPFVFLGINTTPTPFTVRPTKEGSLRVKGNYIRNSAFKGHSSLRVAKKPGAAGGLTRNKVQRPKDNYHQLQNGYTGIGTHPQAGLHDDRPPYRGQATFGGLKFNLPTNGLPDIPASSMTESETKLLRDLPSIDQLDYEDSSNAASTSSDQPQYQFGKSYLKNPYGADFIRLEIDSNRYKHNKTSRLRGIHHIPLKVHGYAETSEYPVSTDTERPLALKNPPKMKHRRPKKQIKAKDPLATVTPSGGGAQKNALSFKAMRDAMEGIPNAIHGLPDLMQSLVTNVWPSSSEPDKKKDNKSNN